MLLVAFLVVALLLVPVFGGRLSALAEFRVERAWLLAAVLAIQVVIVSVLPGTSGWILPAGHILSYALLMWFLIVNREVAGLWLISLGAAMNAVAITANGGGDAGPSRRPSRWRDACSRPERSRTRTFSSTQSSCFSATYSCGPPRFLSTTSLAQEMSASSRAPSFSSISYVDPGSHPGPEPMCRGCSRSSRCSRGRPQL
jgi:Family of unknown function (DUF5317)